MRRFPFHVAVSLVFCLAPGLAEAQATRQPYLQVLTPTSVVVRWNTAAPEAGTVCYGTAPAALTLTASEASPVLRHVVSLSGLSPGQKYFYSVTGPGGGSEDQYAITAPPPGDPHDTRIWVVSDFGQSNSSSDDVRRSLTVDTWKAFNKNSLHANFVLSLGDQSEQDSDAQLQANYFNEIQDVVRNSPLFTIAGNHEDTDGEVTYKAVFSMPAAGEAGGVPSGTTDYYSITYGNIHVVALTVENDVNINGLQTDWLRNDLAQNRSDWLIAIMHRPMHSAGYHPTDGSSTALSQKQNWLPLLEAAGVDLILAGHNHVYERSYLTDNLIGNSTDLTRANKIDTSLGRSDQGGPYRKEAGKPHAGTIFITCQGAGTANGADHLPVPYPFFPIVFKEDVDEGSLVIDVHGKDSLNVTFLCDQVNFPAFSHVWDWFSIVKQPAPNSVRQQRTPIPSDISLGAFPNPFNPSTHIAYDLPRSGRVRLVVLDLLGRVVASLLDADQQAGTHTLEWAGNDQKGAMLPAGMYIARIQSGASARCLKMMLLR